MAQNIIKLALQSWILQETLKASAIFFPSMMKLSIQLRDYIIALFTRLAFSLRNWTKVFLSSLCEIWIPLTLFSCSDSAQNKQFPDAWLSETKNPFSAATVLRLNGRMVLLRTWSASHRKFCKDGRMFSTGKKRQLFLHFQQFDRCALAEANFIDYFHGT